MWRLRWDFLRFLMKSYGVWILNISGDVQPRTEPLGAHLLYWKSCPLELIGDILVAAWIVSLL